MKISPLTILVFGIAAGVIALGFGIIFTFLPNYQETKLLIAQRDKLREEANKMPQVKRKKERAIEAVKAMAHDWELVTKTKTPPASLPNGIDLSENRYQLAVDAPKYRDSVQKAVNAQLKKGGIKVISGVSVPPPPDEARIVEDYFNYPAMKFPVCIFELGAVTVRGTMSQIRANLQAWSNMPNYMAVVSGLQLQGTSPTLTATYNVVVVGFIRATKIAPPVQSGGSSTTTPAGFGGSAAGGPFGGKNMPGAPTSAPIGGTGGGKFMPGAPTAAPIGGGPSGK